MDALKINLELIQSFGQGPSAIKAIRNPKKQHDFGKIGHRQALSNQPKPQFDILVTAPCFGIEQIGLVRVMY